MRHNRQDREQNRMQRNNRDFQESSRRFQGRPMQWDDSEDMDSREDHNERSFGTERFGRDEERDFGRGMNRGERSERGGRGMGRDMRGQSYRSDNYELLDEDRWGPSYSRSQREEQDSERRGRFSGRGPKSYRRSDDRIKEDVCEALTRDAHIDASDVEIEVKEGEVTLSGFVPERNMKHHAEDIIEHCTGVKDVTNNLRVRRESSSTSSASGSSSETEERGDRKNASSSSSSGSAKKASTSTANTTGTSNH